MYVSISSELTLSQLATLSFASALTTWPCLCLLLNVLGTGLRSAAALAPAPGETHIRTLSTTWTLALCWQFLKLC